MFDKSYSTLKVIDLVPYGNDNTFFELKLTRPKWDNFKAGQFAMLRPQSFKLDPLWGRPLSICRMNDDELIFFFQAVGRGTNEMAKLQKGDNVAVWGPLGSSFELDGDKKTLLLAGGIGIVPFAGYIDAHPNKKNLKMLFGHRPSLDSYPANSMSSQIDFKNYQENSIEDRNSFLAKVEEEIKEHAQNDGLILSCGPTPFLKYVADISAKYNAKTQVSLENKMACGVGACLGCVCTPSDKNPISTELPQRSCVNGPVFWAEHIIIDENH